MSHILSRYLFLGLAIVGLLCTMTPARLTAQQPPFDIFPEARPPYYRVRYEASEKPGELVYPVNYTIWIPKSVDRIRGVVVHQHGCGEGSCKSGLTGAYDLHWQALARKHDCALLSPAYEQPDKSECQMWCDPRNGSDAAFQRCLRDLGDLSGHPELSIVPWALWGHSGGGHWAGGMTLLHPERIVATWLRSGVPLFEANAERQSIVAYQLNERALQVPIMCNLGTQEGVSVTDGRFAGVWPANQEFFQTIRKQGGLIGIAIDPLTAHECGNQRYLAIPWLDCCLTARLPTESRESLAAMPIDRAWLAALGAGQQPLVEAKPIASFDGNALDSIWLPDESIAKAWMQFVADTEVKDETPPPAPTNVKIIDKELTWDVDADLESGLASFVIQRDGVFLARLPEQGKNPFGRPVFQNLQYSDTPTQPLVTKAYIDRTALPGVRHSYQIAAINTVNLKSQFVEAIVSE